MNCFHENALSPSDKLDEIQVVLRISDEIDEDYLRIVNTDIIATPKHGDGDLLPASSNSERLYQISSAKIVQLMEEDDLLTGLHSIKYIFVRWGDHWDEINAASANSEDGGSDGSPSNECSPRISALDTVKEKKYCKYFEVHKKPFVNLFEVEIQRASESQLHMPRVCIPLSIKTSIDTALASELGPDSVQQQVELPLSAQFLTSISFQTDAELLSEDLKVRKIHVRYFDHDFEGYVRLENESSAQSTGQQGIPMSAVSPVDHRTVNLLLEYVDIDIIKDKCTLTPSKHKSVELEEAVGMLETTPGHSNSLFFDNKPRVKSADSGRRKNSVLTRRRLPLDRSSDQPASNARLNSVLAMPEFRNIGEKSDSIYAGSKHFHADKNIHEAPTTQTSVQGTTPKTIVKDSKLRLSESCVSKPHADESFDEALPPQSPFFTGKAPVPHHPATKTCISELSTAKVLPETPSPSSSPVKSVSMSPEEKHLLCDASFSSFIDQSALSGALALPTAYGHLETKRKGLWTSEYFPLPFIDAKQYHQTSKWKKLIRKGVPFAFRSSLYTILLSVETFLLTRPSYFFSSICATFPYFSNLEYTRERLSKCSSQPEKAVVYCDSTPSSKSNNPLFFSSAFPHFCPRSVPLFGMHKQEFSALVVSLLCEEGEIAMKTILCVLCNQFPEFSYIPMLPSILCLLLLHLPSADKASAAAYHCIATSAVCLGQRSRIGSSEYLFKENEEFNMFYSYLSLNQSAHLSYLCTVYSLVHKHCGSLKISSDFPKFDTQSTFPSPFHRVQGEAQDMPKNSRSLYVLLIIHALHMNFFTNVLPIPLCLVIMDGYLNEGLKVLVRYSVALLIMFGADLLATHEALMHMPYSHDNLSKLIHSLRRMCTERFWNIKRVQGETKGQFEDLVDLAFGLRIQRGHLNGILLDKRLKKYVFGLLTNVRNIPTPTPGDKNKPVAARSPLRYLFPVTSCLAARPSFQLRGADDTQGVLTKSLSSDRSCFSSPSSIISTPMLWESFFTLLPSKVLINQRLVRVYSTEHDGWSLQSLYQKSAKMASKNASRHLRAATDSNDSPIPTVLLLGVVPCKESAFDDVSGSAGDTPLRKENTEDVPASPLHEIPFDPATPLSGPKPVALTSKPLRRTILGAFLSMPPSRTTQNEGFSSFIGTADTFVFTLHPQVSVYTAEPSTTSKPSPFGEAASQSSSFFYGSTTELRVGLGDAGSSIVLDADLHAGLTSPCKTFNSPQLLSVNECDNRLNAKTKRFQVLQCEVLAFLEK